MRNMKCLSAMPVKGWLQFCSCVRNNTIIIQKLLTMLILSIGLSGLAHANGTYEAELAELEDAHVESIEIGYFGGGYAWCRHQGSLRWNVTVTQDGVYELKFRYALKHGRHNLNVFVDNTLVQKRQLFLNTGSWSTWGESKLRVFLSAGTHTVKLRNRWNNHILVDSLTVSPLTVAQPSVLVGDNILYEAEEALLNRVKIKDNKPGFTGTGYVRFRRFAYADFAIETTQPGDYDLKFRYMQHRRNWRLAIFVDGILDQVVRPPKTGRNDWAEFTLNHSFTFDAGVHAIKIVSLRGVEGKLDSLTVVPINVNDDRDGDGVPDDEDAFPDDPTEWADLDGDGIGDNADLDRDGDGISNEYEELVGTDPNDPFSVPEDLDGDGIPDVLDDDRDGDGVQNDVDVFPDNPFEWADLDGDGIGDNADTDRDGDGISNDYEIQVGTDPNDPDSTPPDLDSDGIPDSLDDDRDGDGVLNTDDAFPDDPAETADLDGDGIGDNADTDRDGDGISNDYEIQVGTDPNDPDSTPPDLDSDGIPDSLDDDRDGDGVLNTDDAFPDDPAETADLDGDGIGDNADTDRDGDGISNIFEIQLGFDPDDPASVPLDFDGDGVPDVIDVDRDGDGVLNTDDIFPDDPTEWADLDGDGIGDNADTDRDGDGISNDYETQVGTDPNDPDSTPPDLDSDGIPDSLDDDRDGDGTLNTDDAFPNDPTETSDLDGDGIGDNADTDRDGDGISNDYEIQAGTDPNDPASTPPDLDSDGIPDSLDDDRDGDGVNNNQDSYPDDSARSQLAAVQNLATLLQGVQISVSWQTHPEGFVQGYQLYRADFGQSNWALLNTSGLLTGTTYIDSNVTNGQAYKYRVTAVDNKNNEGIQTSAVNQFVIYNQNTINDTLSQWNNYQAQINWTYTPATNETARLYRLEGINRTLVIDGSDTQYLDTASVWNLAQNYELVSVLSFTNPITGSVELAEGPVSNINLLALPAINVALTNAIATGANSYQVEIQSGTQLTVTGNYANALTDVQLTLSSSQGDLTVNSNNGEFQFVVRNVNTETMTITLVESGAPTDRGVTLSLNVTPDQTPLTVQLAGAGSATSESSTLINGQVINADAGVSTLVATSNRYEGQSFGLTLLEDDNFSGELPLKTGDNLISVNAAGNLGQTAQSSITITRQASAIPSVEITSHQNNQVVSTNRINLLGRLYTSLEIGQLQFFVGGQPAAITSILEQVYQFRLDNIELSRGFNRIITLTQTPLGNVETAIVIYYQDESIDSAAPLELVMTSPIESEVVNDTVLVVRGQLFNADNAASLSVNGVQTPLFGDPATGLLFSYAIDLNGLPEGLLSIDFNASATGKDPISKTINVTIDNQAPVLSINNALAAPPAVNEVREQPYRISGNVSDINLSTLSINGQGLILQPAVGNTYSFDTGISLNAGEPTTITVVATDTAGNETSLAYEILSNPQASLELIQPLTGAQYHTTGATHDIEFITRINGTSGGENLIVSAGSSQQSFPVTQEIINGVLTINTADTIDSLHFEVQNSSNEALVSTEVAVSLINEDDLALSLEKTNPAKNTKDHEPHTPIQFHFNKPVSLNDLAVSVKQSYHGTTYNNETLSGAGLSDKYTGDIIEVHQDQSPVAGNLSLLPGERIVEFYPDKDLSFGASVFVEINHQGTELGRFIYHVRNTPTFIQAAISDQNGASLEGINVTIPQLGLETITDNNGSFTVGGRGTTDNTIPSGIYRLVINPKQENANYGIGERIIKLDNGRMNRVGTFAIPGINLNVPYRNLSSSVNNNTLVSGDLIIDTSSARLQFSDGSDKGAVHVQMINYGVNIFQSDAVNLSPMWVYNLQPAGIKVTGNIGLQIKMPRLFGSYDYIPPENTPVLLMGQNPDTLNLTPIGVATIISNTVVSQGNVNLERLDYIGYTLVSKEDYPLLQQYLDNTIGIEQLAAQLVQ